ncbi:2-(1,2-epoxy-1,2-dihydrophenyl)acetyl-CoA isomerase [Peribacillus cavernae]|uniref:2-(1,2-epoxy-1,2-dihydrophenyl)acetyl-CoA isomerase n=1 Tax=Peribacillus cavernae TaxID=1674310 RepID=A0A3S0W511_9BACI|nr:enoyl-CoA hydratase-related protein [Peribacillus cavernae]MDQ0218103.1 2-(1,2-epoxy-1,2-dihydrophenyl)acetyl-CoA isomerase [Peribacillus cavernae]RUQ32740.1 2-(1,2-epoxy-1,2-dihydrophenyl)acetyl-CoA isomerase [Peribacillus cavernae]
MEESSVLYEQKEKVAIISLNRPHSLNAMNDEMGSRLMEALQQASHDPCIRAVILTGKGKGFCSGEDLQGGTSGFSPEKVLKERYMPLIHLIRGMDKPVIGAINGAAAGAGFSLALAADIRIASETAKFGQVFVNIGFIPDAGSTYLLPRLIGNGIALEMMLTGEMITANQALQYGIINRVVRKEDLLSQSLALANKLAGRAPLAIGFTKKLVYQQEKEILNKQMELEAEIQDQLAYTEDFKEGVQAFLEKRKPDFKGE